MAVASARIRLHRADLPNFDSHDLGGFRGGILGLWVALAAPYGQRASHPQDWRCVLNHNLERSQSPCCHEVHGRHPLLDSGVDYLDVGQPAPSDRPLQELALAYRALDKMDA